MIISESIKVSDNNINLDIYVYGGDIYSLGKKEHNPPHFHVKIKNKPDIKYLIPSVDEWHYYQRLIIYSSNDDIKINNEVVNWLKFENKSLKILNIESIRYYWNFYNINNNLTTQLDKIYQHEASIIPNNKSIKDIKTLIIKEFKDFKIVLKGGLDYGKNKDSITKPHFYIEVNGGELRALIPTLNDWNIKHYIASGEVYDIFKGMSEVHDEIVKYFNNIDNLKYIQNQWNILNDKNKYVDQINTK